MIKKITKHAVLYLCAAIMILPFLWMLSTSLKTPDEIFSIPIRWIPSTFYIENYYKAVTGFPFARFFL